MPRVCFRMKPCRMLALMTEGIEQQSVDHSVRPHGDFRSIFLAENAARSGDQNVVVGSLPHVFQKLEGRVFLR